MSPQPERTLFVGSFTAPKGARGEGLTTLSAAPEGAVLRLVGVDRGGCPAYLVQHPTLDRLYAASELPDGTIDTYAVEPDGSTRLIAQTATGSSPAHIALGVVDGTTFLFTSHYFGGCFAVHRVDDDGTVGELLDLVDRRPAAGPGRTARAHCAVFAPDGRFVYGTDLGTDQVLTYAIDAETGKITEVAAASTPADAGPRHLALHPDGRLFVSAELGGLVMTFRTSTDGKLEWVGDRPSLAHRSPAGPAGDPVRPQPSEIVLSHGGRFLHVGNRRVGMISTFEVEDDDLRHIADTPTGGRTPRHFAVVDDELYVGNEDIDDVRAFHVDPQSGLLSPTGARVEVLCPVAILVGGQR
ncbi:lactonase family protein [Humibacter sp.]|jgi:6-phosphogluconolactonase|uniref:lactonase family protein n=1 Tax=Humibacter sp. TaxID=1940291 RepID=UPI002BC8C982|nr:beta-propeller fold lactonase family protein [Humibacter sp.]HVX06713.1 beta-propeller fold lactonase family protein [Humibacter sp.]